MPKVCFNCFNVYSDSYNLESCPNIHCPYIELDNIDDLFIDVILKLNMYNFTTVGSCSGHLYEELFNPYVSFQVLKEYKKDLKRQREIFIKNNSSGNIVIEEINDYGLGDDEDYCGFKIYPKVGENVRNSKNEWKNRITTQKEFLGFLYGVVKELEGEIDS